MTTNQRQEAAECIAELIREIHRLELELDPSYDYIAASEIVRKGRRIIRETLPENFPWEGN